MRLLFVFLPGLVSCRASDPNCDVFGCTASTPPNEKPSDPECDDIVFGCSDSTSTTEVPCDAVFGNCETPDPTNKNCMKTVNDIETAIYKGDKRQAFKVCNKTSSCDDYSDQGYQCAPFWQCYKENNTIITDGKGFIDVRNPDPNICLMGTTSLDSTDTKCPKDEEVCCKIPDVRQGRCTPTHNPNRWGKCGRKNIDDTVGVRVTGFADDSSQAQPGEFPHVCIVYLQTNGMREYIGGASLIDENKVLSVAHKFYLIRGGANKDDRKNARKFFVRCGEYNVKAQTELLLHQESRVAKLLFDPEYNPNTLAHNMVILMTEKNFVYQFHIGPICLPKPGEHFENDPNCFSSGWGSSDFTSKGAYSDALKKIYMKVVPREECLQQLRSAPRPGSEFVLDDSWLCVGGQKDKDTCTGDGGSPHICQNKQGDWTQVASVAFGWGCGEPIPSIYSSVTSSVCWIDWVMSCNPLSRYYVDTTEAENVDLRGTDVDSKNGFLLEECEDWAARNDLLSPDTDLPIPDTNIPILAIPQLNSICTVGYDTDVYEEFEPPPI